MSITSACTRLGQARSAGLHSRAMTRARTSESPAVMSITSDALSAVVPRIGGDLRPTILSSASRTL